MYSDFKSSVPIRTLLSFQAERLDDPLLREAASIPGRYGLATSIGWIRTSKITSDVLIPNMRKLLTEASNEWVAKVDKKDHASYEHLINASGEMSLGEERHPYLNILTRLANSYRQYSNGGRHSTKSNSNLDALVFRLSTVNKELYAEAVLAGGRIRSVFNECNLEVLKEIGAWMVEGGDLDDDDDNNNNNSITSIFFSMQDAFNVVQLVEEDMVADWLTLWSITKSMCLFLDYQGTTKEDADV